MIMKTTEIAVMMAAAVANSSEDKIIDALASLSDRAPSRFHMVP